jgi:hypothetical protein
VSATNPTPAQATVAELGCDARIRLVCRYVDRHTLGALIRVPVVEPLVWPVGRQGEVWSDGAGNLVLQRWGKYGQIWVTADGPDQPPISIQGRCERCARERGKAAKASPGLQWAGVIRLLDRAVADGLQDTALPMRW